MLLMTGWKGGSWGLKISRANRDRVFRKAQNSILVVLEMPGGLARRARVNINKPSFWKDTCREMISKVIGEWMHDIGAAPWPKGQPPQFRARLNADGHLLISCQNLR